MPSRRDCSGLRPQSVKQVGLPLLSEREGTRDADHDHPQGGTTSSRAEGDCHGDSSAATYSGVHHFTEGVPTASDRRAAGTLDSVLNTSRAEREAQYQHNTMGRAKRHCFGLCPQTASVNYGGMHHLIEGEQELGDEDASIEAVAPEPSSQTR